MSQQCSQCTGSGMVQTSFGPKPCPNCGGKGYVYESSASEQKSSNHKMSTLQILFYSAIGGVIGYYVWPPAAIFAPFLIYIYLDNQYG